VRSFRDFARFCQSAAEIGATVAAERNGGQQAYTPLNPRGIQMKGSSILRTLVCLVAFSAAGVRCTKETATPPAGPWPRSGYVVANGVRLHYLDWGGKGPAMLLLAGLGHDAHTFKTFAPKFTDSFRVLALTRRGFGKSDRPAGGYDNATRVEDIRQFLDRMKIDRAHLVGDSMAGDEMTLFATTYPQRVIRLVYLDAAINRHDMSAIRNSDPAPMPLPPGEDGRVLAACFEAVDAFEPDYRAITAPALALYAEIQRNHPLSPGEGSLERRKELNAWWAEKVVPLALASHEQFRREMRHGEAVVVPGANHFLFVGKTEDEVVRRTRAFLTR
jgi:pimeloyl-ACP methyl ester carboxylesterase